MRTYRAELLRSVNRATGAFLLLCIALTVFSMVNAGPQHNTPLWGFRQAAIFVATLLMGRAATVTAGDFSTGTIRSWLISAPSRGPVLLGKLAATMFVALGFALVAGLSAYAVSSALGTVPAVTEVATATAQLGFACATLTLFGHSIGVLARSVPVALTVTLAWILPVEAVLDGRFHNSEQWLPGLVAHQITLGQLAPGSTTPTALTHAMLPFLVLEIAALAQFIRSDINS